MNKLLLLILLLTSTGACADWQRIGENASETAYVDAAAVQKIGRERTRMWGLFDLTGPRAFGDLSVLSMKIRREYYCNESKKETRVIALAAYAGHMGKGERVYYSNAAEPWVGIQPDSAEDALWNIACGNK